MQTFVSDEWTLEYDLALGPKDENDGYSFNLAEDVYVATRLAENDDVINSRKIAVADVAKAAIEEFGALKSTTVAKDGCAVEETIAATIYAKFAREGVSKPIAAQYLAVEKELGLDRDKVNVNGGAIALGHPLGATGTRLVITLLYELRRRKKKYGLATACIGGGQGIAMIVESMN